MSHQRTHSHGESLRGPHSVSLKVLRLSRPTLTPQYPLPDPQTLKALGINPSASLGYPTASQPPDAFYLTPLLSLPEAFGSAYVGETFACTLCANNEVPSDESTSRAVSGVRITAEMMTPSSQGRGLELKLAGEEVGHPEKKEEVEKEGDDAKEDAGEKKNLGTGESLQKILRFELKEEGSHTLAVTVTYTETQLGGAEAQAQGNRATGGRVRTFRKLYQFTAQQLLSVRTKTGELAHHAASDGKNSGRYVIEAQLENMGEGNLSLESVRINSKPEFTSRSLNWDLKPEAGHAKPSHNPILNPRDILQVAFLLDQQPGQTLGDDDDPAKAVVLGQLNIDWRSAMGEKGSLSTSWLTCRPRGDPGASTGSRPSTSAR